MNYKIKNRYTGEVILTSENRANLYGANLREANLREANLYGANLREANLREANLYEANLRGADLCGADLRGANLHGADLYGADLYGANLYEANLRGADLCGADLREADLLIIQNIGSESGTLIATWEGDDCHVTRGCFSGTLGEFEEAVKKTHEGSQYYHEYMHVIMLIQLRMKK